MKLILSDKRQSEAQTQAAIPSAKSAVHHFPSTGAPLAGIYVHIPLCKSKCRYCDFYSLPDREDATDRLVQCISQEIHQVAMRAHEWQFDTLYIGGGTPSLLSPHHLEHILASLERVVGITQLREITLEANPGEAPDDKLYAFRQLGVNRISFGFQSFDPDLLRFLGRLHDPGDCHASFTAARKAGFENISADLLFGIPGQTLERWKSDLAELTNMGPEHISTYSLTVEEGTELHAMVSAGKVSMPDEDLEVAMYVWAREYLRGRGYHTYEISNCAREGKICRHNLHYWQIDPYLGFGPAAHGFDGKRRTWNIRSLDGYIQSLEEGRSPVAGGEDVSAHQFYNEKVAFGLRLSAGVSVTDDLGYEDVKDYTGQFAAQLQRWEDCLILSDDRLSLTEQGVMLADTITADLLLEEGDPLPASLRRPPTAYAATLESME
ncbi:MAG: radical SAM family heme chaperone HemW [Fidelibacterota bacterium]|nr:MAG: radical SAM family heme chaperone HemW [Candidatus Neomarinimicrobiota bacterium]